MNCEKAHRDIEAVIINFDFHNLQKVMKFVGWEYASLNGDIEIPSSEQLEELGRSLLNDAWISYNRLDDCGAEMRFKRCANVSSGGFEAVYHEEYGFALKFVIAASEKNPQDDYALGDGICMGDMMEDVTKKQERYVMNDLF